MKEKLKSKVVWLTAVPVIAGIIAMWTISGADTFTQVAMSIISLLSIFGILNNPDSKEKF